MHLQEWVETQELTEGLETHADFYDSRHVAERACPLWREGGTFHDSARQLFINTAKQRRASLADKIN